MKKLMIVLLLFVLAKEGSAKAKNIPSIAMEQHRSDTIPAGTDTDKLRMTDYVMVQAGKVILVKSGKAKPLDTDMTMDDGAVVRINGTYITKDGKTYVLHEGDKVYRSGILEAPGIK